MFSLILAVPAAGQLQMRIQKQVFSKILTKNLACMTTIGISSLSKDFSVAYVSNTRLNVQS